MGNPAGRSFFILSCARSGSTALASILNEARNGECVIEPVPNLNVETRLAMEGKISNLSDVVATTVVPRVHRKLREKELYGEKNVTYGPFIPYLYEALQCKFVFIKRDGRDVVRSLINWHSNKFGTIYRECTDPGRLSPAALSTAAAVPIHLDTSDFSRPRPLRGEPLYHDWWRLTRAEMCAYYWSRINELYLKQLTRIPDETWICIDFTSPTADEILKAADFFGLSGIEKNRVELSLEQRINSLKHRGSVEEYQYPDWRNWDGGMRRRFDRIASGTMYRLGYYQQPGAEWGPNSYGECWQQGENALEWYEWMHDSRRKVHQNLVEWVAERDRAGDHISSIADLGCGLAVGYCNYFAKKKYIGVDLSRKNIDWCKANRANPMHEYHCLDIITGTLPEAVDLVFSSGTIDNSYDIDAFLRAMVRNSRKWIYATMYRGWFPDLRDHRYEWRDEHKCFYNNCSPSRIRETLADLGCTNVLVEPLATGEAIGAASSYETMTIARVPDRQ